MPKPWYYKKRFAYLLWLFVESTNSFVSSIYKSNTQFGSSRVYNGLQLVHLKREIRIILASKFPASFWTIWRQLSIKQRKYRESQSREHFCYTTPNLFRPLINFIDVFLVIKINFLWINDCKSLKKREIIDELILDQLYVIFHPLPLRRAAWPSGLRRWF